MVIFMASSISAIPGGGCQHWVSGEGGGSHHCLSPCSPTSCFGGPGARSQPSPTAPAESVDVFRGRPCNPFPYEFAFELLVKGPCLLAGRGVAQAVLVGWVKPPEIWVTIPGMESPGPSMLLGGQKPPPRAACCTPYPQRSPFPIPPLGLEPPKVTPCMALGSSGSAASFPGETRWTGDGTGEEGMQGSADTLLAAGPVNPVRAGREQPLPRRQVWHRHGGRGRGHEGLPHHLLPLAGLESPSHTLRADAYPWASSAATTCVTLAEPHRYDRDLEIILYPCGEGGRCPWRIWGRWGTTPKASGASPTPLWRRVALNPPCGPQSPTIPTW